MRSRVVQVDTRKITAARRGRQVLKLNLFDDAVVEVSIRRVRPTRTGYFISGAPKGMEWGEVRLVVNGPVMVGTVQTPHAKYRIRSAGSGRHVIRQIDPSKERFECEVEANAVPEPTPQPSDFPAISSIGPMPAGTVSPQAQTEDMPTEDGSEVRVLVAYTPALQARQGGAAGVRALIDLMIQSANQAFEDSGINPRLVLAHAAMVDFVENGSELRALSDPADGQMDEVQGLRNKYAADLVHLLADSTLSPPGSAARPLRESLIFADSAYYAVTNTDSEETFTHEIGHNFGLKHDRYVNSVGSTIYPYAFGYTNMKAFEPDAPRSARWRTVMAYGNQCSDAGFNCPRLLRFSNPDQAQMGDALGVPAASRATGADGPADARLAINNSARWVGSFRSEACTEFTVAQEAHLAPLDGGAISIQVDAGIGCVWEASSHAEFITIESDKRQSGSGFAIVTVAANNTNAERTGTLEVAGNNVSVRQLASSGGICNRTTAVMEAITKRAGFTDIAQCDEVTDEHLARISQVTFNIQGLSTLKEGDFAGLGGLTSLSLGSNDLTSLPEGLFSDLANLTRLSMGYNELTELPAGLFSGLARLESLRLSSNRLSQLPAGVFDGLSNLKSLELDYNDLTSLPPGVFNDLVNLEELLLNSNQLAAYPAGTFAGLSKLKILNLDHNRATELPVGLFADLTSVEELGLFLNYIDDVPEGTFSGLSNLRSLDLGRGQFTTLPAGVFAGLSRLETLSFWDGQLRSLPADVFSGLSLLRELDLDSNHLGELPEGLFTGLSSLERLLLGGNRISQVPPRVFVGLTMLQHLNLSANAIEELTDGSLAGLTGLERLLLADNRFTTLPSGIFSELTSLRHVDLRINFLKSIPDGIFAGLTQLDSVNLARNSIDPLPLQVSLEREGETGFKAVIPAAAPFSMDLPIVVSGGTIVDAASTVVVPAGAMESGMLRVSRESDSAEPVSVNLGALPKLPNDHLGYVLAKDDTLPLRILASSLPKDAKLIRISLDQGELDPVFSTEVKHYKALLDHDVSRLTIRQTPSNGNATVTFLDAGDEVLTDASATSDGHQVDLSVGRNVIRVKVTSEDGTHSETYKLVVTRDGAADGCIRSAAVQLAILAAIPGTDECGELTMEELATITKLDLSSQGISSLGERDLAGLVSLEELNLRNNELRSLTSGVFSELKELQYIRLDLNELHSLPVGVFSGLSSLETLDLGDNQLVRLPSGIFSNLGALTNLRLERNRLSSLPADAFAGLTKLNELALYGNRLSDLPSGIFSDLTALRVLTLYANSLIRLHPDTFSGLGALRELFLGENDGVTDLPLGIFDELPALERLGIGDLGFAHLREGVFSKLTNLRELVLGQDELESIPAGIFTGLNALQRLTLWRTRITSLPEGLFSDLKSLRELGLHYNRLSTLPNGIFVGLSALNRLNLRGNVVDPMQLDISLEMVGNSQFKAVMPTGAPFLVNLPIHTSDSGMLEEGGNSVTIPFGAIESRPVQVMRMAGSEEAVLVNVGELPDLPDRHEGYFLRADASLPLTVLPGPQKPAPPAVTGVRVVPGPEQLEVSWEAIPDTDGYKVQWKSGGETYDVSRQAEVVGGDTVNHTITGLASGTEYMVRLIATKENADDGPPSEEVAGTPQAMPALQVQDVYATAGIEQLDVSWLALPGANGYKVQWKSGDEAYDASRQVVVSGGETVSYAITGLAAGTAYTVRVIATRENAEDGTPSSEVVGVPQASPPAQVTDVEASVGVESLNVSWTAVSDADGYKVQWKSDDESYEEQRQADVSGGETTSYSILDLAAGTVYTIRVIAAREHTGDGEPSEEVTGTPRALPPPKVTGVAASTGVEQLAVSWTAVTGADGFRVEWKSAGDDYGESRQAVLAGGDAVSHTITGLVPGTEYTARVIATLEHADDGTPSDEVTGVPKASPPPQVTGVVVEPGYEELEVSWTAVSDADGYKVRWKRGSEDHAEERQVALLGGETTSYTIIDLSVDTEYTIRVIATREHADDGEPSEEVMATPVSADPDTNGDGTLDGNDALIMFHSFASETQVGNGETGGSAASRQSLLAGYSGMVNPTDDQLKEMIRRSLAWREVGVDVGGDINEDGEIDEEDAFVMYYAYANANLVGDGTTGGTARFRQLLLAAFANKANPTDEDLKAMLRRANKLKEEFD